MVPLLPTGINADVITQKCVITHSLHRSCDWSHFKVEKMLEILDILVGQLGRGCTGLEVLEVRPLNVRAWFDGECGAEHACERFESMRCVVEGVEEDNCCNMK